jgi:membrane associated rhomboid family serine protease
MALIWAISLLGFLQDGVITTLALVPRSTGHLPGIFTMALVHGSWAHLTTNTVPLAVLSFFLAPRGARYFVAAVVMIMLIGGCLLWIFGRTAAHVGASGLIFGLLGTLLANSAVSKSTLDVLIGFTVMGLFAGTLWGVLPTLSGVSWESHLFGLIAGLLTAILLNNRLRPDLER